MPTHTVKPSGQGGDFTSVSDAIEDVGTVNGDTISVEGTWTVADPNQIRPTVAKTDITVIVQPEARHQGFIAEPLNHYLLDVPAAPAETIYLEAGNNNWSFDGMAVYGPTNDGPMRLRSIGSLFEIKNCIIANRESDTGGGQCIELSDGDLNIENSIIYGSYRDAIRVDQDGGGTVNINSCTLQTNGIFTAGAAVHSDSHAGNIPINVFNTIAMVKDGVPAGPLSFRSTAGAGTPTWAIDNCMDVDGTITDEDAGAVGPLENRTLRDATAGGAECLVRDISSDPFDMRLIDDAVNNDAMAAHSNETGAGMTLPILDIVGNTRDRVNIDMGAFAINIAAGAAPILTLPTSSVESTTDIGGTVESDSNSGTLFYLISSNAVETDVAIKAGQSQPVTVLGTQVIATTFTPGAVAYVHYLHENASGDSNIVVSSQVTMPPAFTESAIYDGSVIPVESILHYATGNHDGGADQAVYSDSGAAFTPDEFVGLSVENRTDGSSGIVTANDGTTITATLSGGTDNDWDNGDEMHVVADIANGDTTFCQDQVTVAGESAPIFWYIFDGVGYTTTYQQIITASGASDGLYDVALDPDGTVTLTGAVPDGVPVLSSPTAIGTGETTGSGSVSTDKSSGTLFYLASENASESIANIKAGESPTVSFSGVQNVTVIGLNSATQYYMHYVHTNTTGDSNAVFSPFETQAPIAVLSLPTGSATNTTANGTVTTDVIAGTMYYWATQNASETAGDIITNGSQKSVTVSPVPVSVGGLLENTQYFLHYVQQTSGISNVVSSLAFMTGAAPPVPSTSNVNDAILIVTGGPTINDGLAIWYNMQMNESLRDAEYRFLIENGATPRTLNDMWFQLLTPTYGPGALNDMQLAYWLNGGVF